MSMQWDLTGIYPKFSDHTFKTDMKRLGHSLDLLEQFSPADCQDSETAVEKYLTLLADYKTIYSKLMAYTYLKASNNSRDEEAFKVFENLEKTSARLTEPQVRFRRWIKTVKDKSELVNKTELLKEHSFYLAQEIDKSRYLLSEKEEAIAAELKRTGSGAWSKLQQKLTSTLPVKVEVDGQEKILPLPEVRNLAYSKDSRARKNGFEAELEAYKLIEEPVAAALNGIKGEVITLSEKRGFYSPLEETLFNTRMEMETLQSMHEAIVDFLPEYHDYYRFKARLLGEMDTLPFYDLYAPVGKTDIRFSYDEAKDFILEKISAFSPEMGSLYKIAFEKNWIDSDPRDGKSGGAFCYSIKPLEESRILLNFTGSFTDMTTLAHELGHAYHAYCLKSEGILNSDYPLPLAETASIFSETVICKAALEESTGDEALTILENRISEAGQYIVEIYSRFIFEDNLFKARKESVLSVQDLNSMMSEAQQQVYGNSLHEDYYHPYMWLAKPHYYEVEENYYNFPYAFGLLFALGLYRLSLEKGKSFLEDYKKLLQISGQKSILEAAKSVGINVNSTAFWKASLDLIRKDIQKFMQIASSHP